MFLYSFSLLPLGCWMLDRSNRSRFKNNNKKIKLNDECDSRIGFWLIISGIFLLLIGLVSILLFQVHYETEAMIIIPIVILISISIIFMALGVNWSHNKESKSRILTAIGLICTMSSMVLFVFNFDHNWYYPLISYIITFYILGLVLIMGTKVWNSLLSTEWIGEQLSTPINKRQMNTQPFMMNKNSEGVHQRLSLLRAAEKVAENLESYQVQCSDSISVKNKDLFKSAGSENKAKMDSESYSDFPTNSTGRTFDTNQ